LILDTTQPVHDAAVPGILGTNICKTKLFELPIDCGFVNPEIFNIKVPEELDAVGLKERRNMLFTYTELKV
jgi:hypothetical protein